MLAYYEGDFFEGRKLWGYQGAVYSQVFISNNVDCHIRYFVATFILMMYLRFSSTFHDSVINTEIQKRRIQSEACCLDLATDS